MSSERTDGASASVTACETCVFRPAVNSAVDHLTDHRQEATLRANKLWDTAQMATEASQNPTYQISPAITAGSSHRHSLEPLLTEARRLYSDVRVIDEAIAALDTVECTPPVEADADQPCQKVIGIVAVLRSLDALEQ